MATLLQRKSGVYYFVYSRNGKRNWKSLRTKDKNIAKKKFRVYEDKLEQTLHGLAPAKVSIINALDSYLERKQTTIKPSTFEQYKWQVSTIKKYIDVEYIHEINLDVITLFIKKRQKQGKANKTIKEELTTIKAATKQAYSSGLINEMPIREWPSIKVIPKKPDTLGHYSIQEVDQLKKHFKNTEFEGSFLFAVYTGCRKSEIIEMTASNINLIENFIKIRNAKTESNAQNQFRTISIHPELLPLLQDRCKGKKSSSKIFPELGKHHRKWATDNIRRACEAIGIQYRRFHGLRHTAATYLVAAGVPLREVMALMGWTRLETAQKYIHLANAAAAQMSKLPY